MIDKEIDGYQSEFGVTPQTTNNLVILRRVELKVARQSGNEARYDALVQKLTKDPLPAVTSLVTKIVALKSKPLDLKFTASQRSISMSRDNRAVST